MNKVIKKNKIRLVYGGIIAFAVVGLILLSNLQAQDSSVTFEAEDGATNLATSSSSDASGGQYIEFTGGSPGGGPTPEITACSNPTVRSANSSNLSSVLGQSKQGCHVINLAPGQYGNVSYSLAEGQHNNNHLTLRCAQMHQCVFTRLVFTWYNTVIVDGIKTGGVNVASNVDYSMMLFYGREAQIKNVHVDTTRSSGQTHGISFKNYVARAEVLNNTFQCYKHCLELSQNGNIASRNAVVGEGLVSGNTMAYGLNIAGVGIIHRNICDVHVHGNTFTTGGTAIFNSPFWANYLGSPVLVPKCPLNYNPNGRNQGQASNPITSISTKITNNTFSGNSINMTSLGVRDDWVYLKDNQGSYSCSLRTMDSAQRSAHADEQTGGPPKLAAGSDPC